LGGHIKSVLFAKVEKISYVSGGNLHEKLKRISARFHINTSLYISLIYENILLVMLSSGLCSLCEGGGEAPYKQTV
jgi:hypothetical protein